MPTDSEIANPPASGWSARMRIPGPPGFRRPGTALREAVRIVEAAAPTRLPVLILGETGVGKERMASMVHSLSPRRLKPMVLVNCATLPPSIAESELFGHERGAFTGAVERRVGRFEHADGSTLFLDEIGEMPLDVQAKLLRILEDGSFEALGSSRTRRVDVRVVAATNRDLEAEVGRGCFREDLLHRLNVFPVRIPPLRERRDEIRPLAETLAREIAQSMGRAFEGFDESSMARLEAHDWPGNVRELRNVLTRAMVLSTGGPLRVDRMGQSKPTCRHPARVADRLADVMRAHVVAVLDECGWRVRGRGGAAEILGVAPTTLESRMKRWGIRRAIRA